MSLKDRLKAEIAATGPMTVAQYMTACLHDPTHGEAPCGASPSLYIVVI